MRMRIWLVATFLLLATAVPALASEGGERELVVPEWAESAVAIITFVVLLLLLGKLAWKPILSGLQEREATIKKALDDAQKANEDALALLEQYGRKMDEARTDAQAIADGARKDFARSREGQGA